MALAVSDLGNLQNKGAHVLGKRVVETVLVVVDLFKSLLRKILK